jgi:hypothetical protein
MTPDQQLRESFIAWWHQSYAMPPGNHTITTHTAYGAWLLSQPQPDPTGLRILAPAVPFTISHENLASHWELTVNDALQRLADLQAAGQLAFWDGYGAVTVTRIGPTP